MENYNYYLVKIVLHSPLSTPFQGDIIWGHICWGIKYFESENNLTKFLNLYNYKNPPLIVSDGFIENTLPTPILTPYVSETLTLKQMQLLKQKKKINFIPANFIFENETLSIEALEEAHNYLNTVSILRNTIDRLKGITKEDGGLYETTEYWYDKDTVFDIYVYSLFDISTIEKYFKYAFAYGYGKDASIGKGIITVKEVMPINMPSSGNRAVALSNFIPCQNDKIENLFADIFTKFGKLGGEFAISKNPFKKPIIMYKTGATFQLEDKKFFVGTLLDNVHKENIIKHYAYAPLIYFNEEVKNV
jgi:CRISPR-associated protein Csm4